MLIVEVIITASIVFILHLFLQGFFPKKSLCAWFWIITYFIFGCGLFLFGRYPSLVLFRLIYNTCSAIILALLLFETKFLSAIYAGISISAIFILSEILIMAVLTIYGLDAAELVSQDPMHYIYSIISQIVSLILVLFIICLTKQKRTAVSLPFILLLSPTSILSIWLGCELGSIILNGGNYPPKPFLLTSIGLIYMNILLVFYAERVKETSQLQKEYELAEQHYVMQEKYYDQLRIEQHDTRAMFHDINKHLCAMRALISDNHVDQAVHVLNDAQVLFDSIGNVIDVGNSLISVILNEYRITASANEIRFDFDVSIPKIIDLDAVDAYIILGNTLDNAIEACKDIPKEERYIHLQLKQYHNIIFYQLENSFNPNQPKNPPSNKRGYGLKSVKKCIEKYNGSFLATQKQNSFLTSIRLNVSSGSHAKFAIN